jgi:hypothetical protein
MITALLLAFVGVSVVVFAVQESRTAEAPTAVTPETAEVERQSQLVVFYFFTKVRCTTCHKLETYTDEALKEFFADELAAGRIVYRPLNTDEPEHEHFRSDYQLVSKSVVLSARRDGVELQWKNLERIWNLVGDEAAFKQYIRDEVAGLLGAA